MLPVNQAVDDFFQYISDLQWTQSFSDLTIQCADGKIKTHCIILGCLSPFLKKLFIENSSNGEEAYLCLPDITVEDMKSLLSLLYTGTANVLKT